MVLIQLGDLGFTLFFVVYDSIQFQQVKAIHLTEVVLQLLQAILSILFFSFSEYRDNSHYLNIPIKFAEIKLIILVHLNKHCTCPVYKAFALIEWFSINIEFTDLLLQGPLLGLGLSS